MLDFSLFFPPGTRPSEPLMGCGFILYGPRRAGKSSFAFQAAVNTVLRGGSVVVLCHEQCVYRKVPTPFTPLHTLSEAELGRLEFVYINDWKAALKELFAMDLPQQVPDLLMVEDDAFPMDHRHSHAAAAQCLSYLENMRERMALPPLHRRMTYLLVSNAIDGASAKLELPLSAFPMVQVRFTNSGVVHVVPLPSDTDAVVRPLTLEWTGGLRVVASSI